MYIQLYRDIKITNYTCRSVPEAFKKTTSLSIGNGYDMVQQTRDTRYNDKIQKTEEKIEKITWENDDFMFVDY